MSGHSVHIKLRHGISTRVHIVGFTELLESFMSFVADLHT